MPIDLSSETVLSLRDATHKLPRRRAGKKPNVATLYRWGQRGCRGIRLETIRVGGTLCTSVEALQRFCDRLSEDRGQFQGSHTSSSPSRLSPRLEKRVASAAAELSAAGI